MQWKNSTPDQNSWYTRDKLEEMGFSKLVNDVDAKEAARLGLVTRPLTEAVVQKHLEDLGLEAGFGTHSQMRGLSGAPASGRAARDAHALCRVCSSQPELPVSGPSVQPALESCCAIVGRCRKPSTLACWFWAEEEEEDLWQMRSDKSCLPKLAGSCLDKYLGTACAAGLTGGGGLSAGGQKVKVVIAAAMWNNPHILVLDEPTNYLDRDSLGALAGAIKEYGGGIVMITHNRGEPPHLPPNH